MAKKGLTHGITEKRTKIKAWILALSFVLGSVGITSCSYNKNKEETPTKVSDTNKDNQDSDLLLVEDFDINDKDAVRKRAEEIYKISEKDYTVDEIENMIYITANKFENFEFSSSTLTENQKFEEIQYYMTGLNKSGTNSVFDDNIADEVNQAERISSSSSTIILPTDDEYVHSYMFDYNEDKSKEVAKDLARIVNKQKELLEAKDTPIEELEKNADLYYDAVEAFYKNKDVSNEEFCTIDDSIADQLPLFTHFLSKKKVEQLEKQHRDLTKNNIVGSELAEAMGIDLSNLEPCDEHTTTPDGNYYNTPEIKEANANETKKKYSKEEGATAPGADKGGKHIGTVTKTEDGTYTTRVEVTTGIPDNKKDKDGNPTTKHTESTSKGGQIVSTTVVVSKDPEVEKEEATKNKPTTTKPTTTKHEEKPTLSREEYEKLLEEANEVNVSVKTETSYDKEKMVEIMMASLVIIGASAAIGVKYHDNKKKKGKVKQK